MTLDLARLKSLHAAATQGDWTLELEYDSSGDNSDSVGTSIVIPEIRRVLHDAEWAEENEWNEDLANGRAICALHNAAPELIARAELATDAAGTISALVALLKYHLIEPDKYSAGKCGQQWLKRYRALEADHGKD